MKKKLLKDFSANVHLHKALIANSKYVPVF